MAYVRKEATASPIMSVEQARRRNAELRIELARLEAEKSHLGKSVETMRLQVSAARRKLTRQTRELDAARIQAERLASVAAKVTKLPEPVYGGRAGLLAATEEMEAYEFKKANIEARRRIGPSHGTGKKYATGCRCEDCMGWRRKKTGQEKAAKQIRRDRRLHAVA